MAQARVPKGNSKGGQFTSTGGKGKAKSKQESMSLVSTGRSESLGLLVVPKKNATKYPKIIEHNIKITKTRAKTQYGGLANVAIVKGKKLLVHRKTTKLDINRTAEFVD